MSPRHEMIPREADLSKQESGNAENFFKVTSSTWSRLKDPRIVRVSKALGGKDRHSKVCTVKGLRDRRVRLSVPTAIQLYDLQDRLGLDQPSKAVDWLLNAAKHEIDELPPLQIPPGSFQQILASQAAKQGLNISCSPLNMRPNNFEEKSATDQVMEETNGDHNWRRDEEERQLNLESHDNHAFIAAGNNFSSRENSYLRWDPSNLSLPHPPKIHGSAAVNQTPEDWHNFGLVPISGSHHHHHHHHQILVYQQQPYFAPQMAASSRSSLGTSSVPPAVQAIHFMNTTASILPSQDRRE